MEYALSELFTLQMGKTPSRDNSSYWKKSENNWISIADLTNSGKYISSTKETLSDSAVAESGIKKIPANTVIMSFKLSLGKVAITEKEMYSNEAIMAFIDKGVEKISPEYLYYLLRAKDWSKGTNKAVMGATLNKATLSTIKIQLHEYDNQLEIVNMLNRVSSSIDFRKQQLTKLDELIKARFVEMFGDVISNSNLWPICKFSEITSSRLGKMLDAKQQTGVHRYPYLANFNVQWFRFELKTLNSMDFNESDRIEFELHDGDLLVCEGGEIGRCAVWHNNVQPCYFQKALHRVRCNKDFILPDFLAWWFKYNCDHGGFSAIEGAKATIAHLPGAKLKNLDVCVPPLPLQNQFADFVAEVDKSKLLAELFAQSTCILAENRSK
jgi:type I restriction enzyme S subunit